MRTEDKLNAFRDRWKTKRPRIMIVGLGSVGTYLLDYTVSGLGEPVDVAVVGRNLEKMTSDVNIVKVAAIIRNKFESTIRIFSGVDFEVPEQIADCISQFRPDIIINSSRAYSGLKYGSISWKNVRAYGIWAPLSIKYVRNLMVACDISGSKAVVINTSYSDATVAWLKSAGHSYPDFGSGNLNHLVPRVKMAIGSQCGIADYWNIDITWATSHFHDVVISKEGQDEGVSQLISARYGGKAIDCDFTAVFRECAIPMPVDAKRNMMNASSNFAIIKAILDSVRGAKAKVHCPGPFGEIGGYPVIFDGTGEKVRAYISEECWSLDEMRAKNRESIYHDGIEGIDNGCLFYTDELLDRVRKVFGTDLPKKISYSDIDKTAGLLINEIIEKNRSQ